MMFRNLLLILLISCCTKSKAATYFFSTLSGDDSRTASEAQNASTPWKTIDKLNSIFQSLQPGDSILFKRGEVFYGSIAIHKSGNPNAPIVFSAFGNGAKPVISGLTVMSGWISKGDGVWEATNSSFASRINTLLINGEAKEMGRYPNSNAGNKGYLIFESSSGNSQITDTELSSSTDWTGGEVVIRKNRWIIDRNYITLHSGNTIHYNSESGHGATPKFGYFIQNHPKTLDVQGEWYFKSQEKKLGVFFLSGSPASQVIEASTVEDLVTANGHNNVVFDNLTFKGANSNAFNLQNSQAFRISNCELLFSGVNALNAVSSNGIVIENSIINHTNNNGIAGNFCSGFIIRNNKIKNTGLLPGMGKGGDGNHEAIVIDGNNELIERNEIDSTGYIPITFRGSENIIRNNVVRNFTLTKDDGGGIYTWNNIPGAPLTYGNKIIGNIVLNGVGAGEGTENPLYLAANGIYMDDNTANVEIIGNTVVNCALQGMYIHNGHELTIKENTLYNNRKQLAVVRDDFAPNSPVRNLNMQQNIFFSREIYQPIAEFATTANDIRDFGSFDANFYCRPLDESSVIITTNYSNDGNNTVRFLSLDEWKAAYGKDISSQKSPFQINSSNLIRFEYNATAAAQTVALDTTYFDVRNNTYTGSVTLEPFSSVVLLKRRTLDTIVPPSTCPDRGSILREQWDNVPGVNTSDVPLHTNPSSSSQIALFEGPTGIAENYASRIRGYICPPVTGHYTFWIAGDDASDLFLSTDDKPENKIRIASVPVWANPRDWYKFPEQQSATIHLVAGNKYYIEAIHKEGVGGDNLAVAWQLPNGMVEAPIPGNRLSSFSAVEGNKLSQTISFATIPNKTYGDAPFSLAASSTSGLPVSFRLVSGPASISGSVVTLSGTGEVVIEASQQGDATYHSAPPMLQTFFVSSPGSSPCASGTILRELWNNVPGNNISDIPLQTSPGSSNQLTSFESPSNTADNYATRIRGYICPPATGNYLFWIAGDDASELWISSDDKPENKIKRAFILSWTNAREWNKFSSQKSVPIFLEAGKKYYIEAIHKEGEGGDNLAVAWQLPNGSFEGPIQGSRLSPYLLNTSKIDQTITFPALASKTFGDAPFALSASSSSGLPVSFRVVSGPATLTNHVVTLTGAGIVTIEASQPGDASYHAATPVMQNLIVEKAAQSINFDALPDKTYGDGPFEVSATASSTLPVNYRVVSGPATINGNTVTITEAGTVVIEASQAGDINYHAATPIQRNVVVAKATQTITFPGISNKTYGDAPFAVNAAASSGLSVNYRVVSGPATVSGNIITLTGPGTVIIEASQSGNASYYAALPVQQSFLVTSTTKQNQTITFGTLAYKTYTSPPFELTATSSSGLPVNYRIVSGPAAVAGNVVTINGTGMVYVEASQPGNIAYNEAAPVQRGFTVGKAGQTITFAPVNKVVGDPPYALTATASSGLAVLYRVVSGPATVSGNIVTLTGTGTVTIEASQPGNENYSAAYPLRRSFTVSASTGTPKQNQSITFGTLVNKTFGDPPFILNATSSSNLPVSFSVVSGPATVSGNTVNLTGAGIVTIQATQSGDATYNAASPVSQSFTVAKGAQVITFGSLANKKSNDAPFTLSGTASSFLPVSFRVVSGPATISGNTVTLTGAAGTVTIEAAQSGNANYNPATPVHQSFTVLSGTTTKINQVITFGTLAYKTYSSPPFELTATASSGLPVSFRVVSGPATISGNLVTIGGVGFVTVEAMQAGDANYNEAAPVRRSFQVGKAGQTITFGTLVNKVFGDSPFELKATASSGLPVSFRVVSGPAIVSGNVVTLTGVGIVVIEASQSGNEFYNAAYSPQRSFTVTSSMVRLLQGSNHTITGGVNSE